MEGVEADGIPQSGLELARLLGRQDPNDRQAFEPTQDPANLRQYGTEQGSQEARHGLLGGKDDDPFAPGDPPYLPLPFGILVDLERPQQVLRREARRVSSAWANRSEVIIEPDQ